MTGSPTGRAVADVGSDRPVPRLPRLGAFNAAPTEAEAGRSAARGGAVTLAAQAAKAVLQTAAIAVLARLLDSGDYGLVAMSAAAIGFVELFKDFGLSLATVQRARVTHEQISALFWINGIAGAVMAVGVVAAAPVLARVYGEPRLTALTAASAAAVVLGGLTVQHLAVLRRRMEFGTLAALDVGSHAAGLASAVAVAAYGGGAWALVAQQVVAAAATAVGVVLVSDWRPSRRVWAADVRPMLSFGADMAGCNTLSYLSKTLDNVLIGWCWGPASLGIYTRAYAILLLPVTYLNGPLAAVAIPVLSRLRDRPRAFADYYLRFLTALLTMTLPAAFTMWLFADDVVRVLLGPNWAEAGPVLRALSAAAPVLPVWYACGWLFASTGRTRQYLLLWAVMFSALAFGFALGLPGGPLGVARAYSVAMWSLIPVFLVFAVRGTGVDPGRLAVVIATPFAACLVGAGLILVPFGPPLVAAGPAARVAAGAFILAASSSLSCGLNRDARGALRAAVDRRFATKV